MNCRGATSASVSPSRVKSQSGNFFRVNVGRPAVTAKAAKRPAIFLQSLACLSTMIRGDSSLIIVSRDADTGCHPSSVLFHDIHGISRIRDFEISREFWNWKWEWEVEGKIGLGWVGLAMLLSMISMFGWFSF